MDNNLLLIPLDGDLELTTASTDTQIRSVLEAHGAEGTFVCLNFQVDHEPGGRVAFLVNDNAEQNYRARSALADLCGVHVAMTGHVALVDVDPVLVAALVHDLR